MAKKFEGYSGAFACVVVLVYIASIAAIVAEAQIMPKSIQQTLSPADSKSVAGFLRLLLLLRRNNCACTSHLFFSLLFWQDLHSSQWQRSSHQ